MLATKQREFSNWFLACVICKEFSFFCQRLRDREGEYARYAMTKADGSCGLQYMCIANREYAVIIILERWCKKQSVNGLGFELLEGHHRLRRIQIRLINTNQCKAISRSGRAVRAVEE